MTTIVLAHRTACQIPGYDAHDVHRVFAAQEFAARDEAERIARKMMEEYEADHFRRVVSVGERIG